MERTLLKKELFEKGKKSENYYSWKENQENDKYEQDNSEKEHIWKLQVWSKDSSGNESEKGQIWTETFW